MKLHTFVLSLLSLVALPLASIAAQPAGAGTVGFGGTPIPGGAQSTSYVITKPGSYYLAGDRSMTADITAIIVNVPDVTIDLNGCTLSYTGGSTANGIEIPATSNVEIRNGSINDVPGDAIRAVNGSVLRIVDVHVANAGKFGLNSTTGLTAVDRSDFSNCGMDGIYIDNAPSMSQVRNTTVMNNGRMGVLISGGRGSEVSGCKAQNNQQSGIALLGVGGLISDNVLYNNNVSKLTNHGGIAVGSRSTVRNNVVCGNNIHGIYVSSSGCNIEGNTITITANAANNVNLGNAITFNFGGGLVVNNRISPSTNTITGSFTNGGGNILY
jgi:parallel beta-helix repeat protein